MQLSPYRSHQSFLLTRFLRTAVSQKLCSLAASGLFQGMLPGRDDFSHEQSGDSIQLTLFSMSWSLVWVAPCLAPCPTTPGSTARLDSGGHINLSSAWLGLSVVGLVVLYGQLVSFCTLKRAGCSFHVLLLSGRPHLLPCIRIRAAIKLSNVGIHLSSQTCFHPLEHPST